jgi:hypothetical protein
MKTFLDTAETDGMFPAGQTLRDVGAQRCGEGRDARAGARGDRAVGGGRNQANCTRGPDDVTTLFDEPPSLGVGDSLEAIVCAELAVDMMEVVAERLGGDTQSARNRRRVAAVGEELENAKLLLGKRFDRCVLGAIISDPDESLCHFHHLAE